MPYLLDTDTCSYIMKRHPLSVLKHLQTIKMSPVGISSMTLAELRYGVERHNSSRFIQQDIDFFISHLNLTVFACTIDQLLQRIKEKSWFSLEQMIKWLRNVPEINSFRGFRFSSKNGNLEN